MQRYGALLSIALIILQYCAWDVNAISEKYGKLLKLAAEKPNHIIEFSGESIDRYATSARDFDLIVLITTDSPKYKCEMCSPFSDEFNSMSNMYYDSLGSEAYASQNFLQKPTFFGKCDIQKCMDFFKAGSFRNFPIILRFPPSKANTSEVDYRLIEKLDSVYDDFRAVSLAAAVGEKIGYKFAPEPPLYRTIGSIASVIALVLLVGKLLWDKLADVSKKPWFWFALSLGVFAFVMAGTVFNSIHRPPLYYSPQNGRGMSFIYPAARHQFVLEGLIMAVLFVTGSLFFAGFTHLVPTFQDPWKQRGIFFICALGCWTCWSWTMTIFRVKYPYYPFWK